MNARLGIAVSILGVSLLAAGLALVAVRAAPVVRDRTGDLMCRSSGGKWASSWGVCVTRACYAQHRCGSWVRPAARCSHLRPGVSIAEVYFQLGDPNRIDGDKYEWFGKGNFGGTSDVEATIQGGKLVSLLCH
jgi:hypothetical protein